MLKNSPLFGTLYDCIFLGFSRSRSQGCAPVSATLQTSHVSPKEWTTLSTSTYKDETEWSRLEPIQLFPSSFQALAQAMLFPSPRNAHGYLKQGAQMNCAPEVNNVIRTQLAPYCPHFLLACNEHPLYASTSVYLICAIHFNMT